MNLQGWRPAPRRVCDFTSESRPHLRARVGFTCLIGKVRLVSFGPTQGGPPARATVTRSGC
jgi:hypothetical protein